MNRNQIWRKRFRKNWKIWLVSLLLTLVLIGRLAASVNRLRQPPTMPKPSITAEATQIPRNRSGLVFVRLKEIEDFLKITRG